MQKTLLTAAAASVVAMLALAPTFASADHRHYRDWDRGPGFSIYVGPRYSYRHRDFDDRYAYYYGRHHHDWDHDWDRD